MFSGIIETIGEVLSSETEHDGNGGSSGNSKNSGKLLKVAHHWTQAEQQDRHATSQAPHSARSTHSTHSTHSTRSTHSKPQNLSPPPITRTGASIAINGVCTTVIQFDPTTFTCFVSKETLALTNLKTLEQGSLVNLETSLTYGAKIDGHLIYGHIDDTLPLTHKSDAKNSWILQFAIKSEHRAYLIRKGPVALNGISLTVYNITPQFLEVMIIPHTYTHTNLHTLNPGANVNIEFDTLPKYLEQLLKSSQKSPITQKSSNR